MLEELLFKLLIFSAEEEFLMFLFLTLVEVQRPRSLVEWFCLATRWKDSSPFVLLKLRRRKVALLKIVLLGGVAAVIASFASFDFFSGINNLSSGKIVLHFQWKPPRLLR